MFVADTRADLTYALRLFARSPAMFALTIAGLSIGLGIATAAFGIMNAAVLRGDGLVDPDRAPGVLRTTERSTATTWGYDEFVHLRAGSTRMRVEGVVTDMALVTTDDPAATATRVAFVSDGFFAATGGALLAGRALQPGDEHHADAQPVVVSYDFWTSRLNRDPAAVGREIRLGRTPATIVGVMARGFSVPHNGQIWMPLAAYGAVYDIPSRRTPDSGLEVFGRLLPAVTLAEADAELNAVAAALPRAQAGSGSVIGVRLDTRAGLGRAAASDTRATASFVFAVIAIVLVLACANAATVLVAAAITREREMGIRAALGASRPRLLRQLVTESLALGAIAAGIGLLFAAWALPLIGTMIDAPTASDLAPDLTVYAFLAIVTLVSGVAAGLAPAWHGRGADLVSPLKGEGARETHMAPRRLRSALVMTQAAASVLLMVVAALFVRAALRAATIDIGFDPAGLYSVSPGVGDAINADAARVRTFWTRAMSELESVPGLAAFTLVELTPFGNMTRTSVPRDGSTHAVFFNRTRAEYFDTLGLRIVEGRTFTRDEISSRAAVAVISQSLARAYWHERTPLGHALPRDIPIPPAITMGPRGATLTEGPRPVIIGVVSDALTERLHERGTFAVYEPLDAASESFAQLLLRVAPGTTGVLQHARQRLRAIDPQAAVTITSVAERFRQEAGRPQMLATLTGVVGVIAIVLCGIGLYGLTSAIVAQRTREMGVRVAMGAEPRDLLRLLLWDSLRPVVLGLVAGAGAAALASRVVVSTMFFGVSPQDPLAYTGAAIVVVAASTFAITAPTRRAATTDAAVALRRS